MSALASDSSITVAGGEVSKNKRKGSRGVRGEPAPTEARRVAEAGSAVAGLAELTLPLLQEEES